jgi:hypothetical protein
MNTKTVTLSDVKSANPQWFAKGNSKFFGDCSYQLLRDNDHEIYLVRSTYGWSDMFGQPKKLTYRINPIDKTTLKIGTLYDNVFNSIDDVKDWLKDD